MTKTTGPVVVGGSVGIGVGADGGTGAGVGVGVGTSIGGGVDVGVGAGGVGVIVVGDVGPGVVGADIEGTGAVGISVVEFVAGRTQAPKISDTHTTRTAIIRVTRTWYLSLDRRVWPSRIILIRCRIFLIRQVLYDSSHILIIAKLRLV